MKFGCRLPVARVQSEIFLFYFLTRQANKQGVQVKLCAKKNRRERLVKVVKDDFQSMINQPILVMKRLVTLCQSNLYDTRKTGNGTRTFNQLGKDKKRGN